jgi:hypothetical protein
MFRNSDGRMYDVGSIALVPHIFLSSRRHFLEAALEGSRSPEAYAGISGE